jgi:hypothetical protein
MLKVANLNGGTMTKTSCRTMPKINCHIMSNQELLNSTKGAVRREKELTSIVLDHLAEVERRKVYCQLGISSLFRYCVEVLGYSEAESSYRVNATRLVAVSSCAKNSIADGSLSLTAASKINRHLKEEQKKLHRPLPPVQVENIVRQARGHSTRQLETMLNRISSTPDKRKVRLELNERLLSKLEKLRKIYGEGSDLDILEMALDDKIAHMEQAKTKRKSKKKSANPRYIDRAAKEAVRTRSGGQCEYISPHNETRCTARLHLQIDHILPLALGGKSEQENLRHLCFAHNQHSAINLLGEKRMERATWTQTGKTH